MNFNNLWGSGDCWVGRSTVVELAFEHAGLCVLRKVAELQGLPCGEYRVHQDATNSDVPSFWLSWVKVRIVSFL